MFREAGHGVRHKNVRRVNLGAAEYGLGMGLSMRIGMEMRIGDGHGVGNGDRHENGH